MNDFINSLVSRRSAGNGRVSFVDLFAAFNMAVTLAATSRLVPTTKAALTRTPLSAWLRAVPGARLSPEYYTSYARDGFHKVWPSSPQEWPISDSTTPRVLELAAGDNAHWSAAVQRKARPPLPPIVAGDITMPRATPPGVLPVVLDNMQLSEAVERFGCGSFDVIYGSHVLCTCKYFVAKTGTTCGGLRIERGSVRRFVNGLRMLMSPVSGIALFDHEGGWPFGLERLIREEAAAAGLYFYVRRGPFYTNFNYIVSAEELDDDISNDPLQLITRASDTAYGIAGLAVIGFLLLATLSGEALSPVFEVRVNSDVLNFFVVYVWLRTLLPLGNVFTVRDLLELPHRIQEGTVSDPDGTNLD